MLCARTRGRVIARSSTYMACADGFATGGTGLVGLELCRKAVSEGFNVIAISRRGCPRGRPCADLSAVEWVTCDVTEEGALHNIFRSHGPFDAIAHCVGALFDGPSGLGFLNTLVSYCGSRPHAQTSYDVLTRQTAFEAIELAERTCARTGAFVFISAAEAGWPTMRFGPSVEWLAPNWLRRYLAAKRAVEARVELSELRGVVFRPSFVWRLDKLDILLPALLFTVLNALGVPFCDRPVHVTTIVDAIFQAIQRPSVRGIQRYTQMEELAAASRRPAATTAGR